MKKHKEAFVIEMTLPDSSVGYFCGAEKGTCSSCIKEAKRYNSEDEATAEMAAFFGPGPIRTSDPIVVKLQE